MTGPGNREDSDERLLALFAAAPPVEPLLGQTQFEHGDLVAGSYRVEGTLGSGGMGVVYRARDLALDRPVAIKLHSRHTSESASERLVQEAKAMARLAHPNVLTIYEIGRHEVSWRGTGIRQYVMFIAMELVEGTTLRSWLGARRRSGGEITRMFIKAGLGLAAAHRAGLVHRDFKPDNVLVDETGRPRVADFGLARMLDDPSLPEGAAVPVDPISGGGVPLESLTVTGVILGTRAYMAPEQADCRGDVNARADQYAFCVSLYEGLHGRRPNDPDLALGGEEGTRGGAIPRRLLQAVERGLSAAPEARFASMDALLRELQSSVAPKTRQRVVFAVAVVGVVGAAWLGSRETATGCDVQAQLRAAWDAARGDRVEQGLRNDGGPLGAAVATRVRTRLDDYAEQWSGEVVDACEATHVRHTQSAEAFDLRMACLGERRDELATLAEVLAAADEKVAAAADRAVLRLSSLAPCADLESLRRVEPIAQGDRIVVQKVSHTIARAKSEREAGHYDKALRLAESALEQANALGYRAVRGRALMSVGEAQVKLGRPEQACEAYEDAHQAALAGGDDRTALQASLGLAYSHGYQLHRVERGQRWLKRADAWLARVDAEPMLSVSRHLTEGLLLREQGRLEDAELALNCALTSSKTVLGDKAREVRRLVVAAVAVTHATQGEMDEAVREHHVALSLAESVYGVNHPSVATELSNLGATEVHRGNFDEGARRLRRALEILTTTLPPSHPQVLIVRLNLASALIQGQHDDDALEVLGGAVGHADAAEPRIRAVLYDLLASAYAETGRYEDADASYQHALVIAREDKLGEVAVLRVLSHRARLSHKWGHHGQASELAREGLALAADSPAENLGGILPYLHSTLGDAHLAGGRWKAALGQFELALDTMEQYFGADHPHLHGPLQGLAECWLELGQPDQAEPLARRSLALGRGEDRPEHAHTRYILARILWARGVHEEARAVAVRAREDFDIRGRVVVEKWLNDHDGVD